MDQQIAQQVGIGILALAVGVSGWVLPFRAIAGAAVLAGTAIVGKFN